LSISIPMARLLRLLGAEPYSSLPRQAIAAGDEDAADQAMRAHIANTIERVRATLSPIGG
jgi:hypothetical protein